MKGKRGVALADLSTAIIAILVIGIAMGVGMFILLETSDAISTTVKTVTNETLTTMDITGETVALATECGFDTFTVVRVYNATGKGDLIPATNYTASLALGRLTSTTATDQWEGVDWNVTYTYTGGGTDTQCTSLTTARTGLGGFASWIAVIVVVFAAAIVLGVVINSFGGTGKSSSV